jgi:adsorption protein B
MLPITGYELLVILRDICLALTWFVAMVFLLSGVQDLIYDIGAYSLRAFRRFHYRNRERLSLARLRAREQQRIAVLVPAWNEGEVVGAMVANIIERVEYRNYVVFVGTYPNDSRTQNAVNRLAAQHPQIINVVNVRPGPTTKADCLNSVYRTLKAYELREGINFDILVMHDAEDVVHPHSFLLYNYLIPRVDAIQLPILPLPTAHHRIVHWIYADEFSETHMKDVPVREKISGFVPFAGTGTGFSRRAFTVLEMGGEKVYNEGSMTEDYSMSKRMREAGLRIVFVNVVLADDKSPWGTPLYKRPGFISNWAYFPMDFTRSIRQKTRWIIGISLQEWEHGGWKGNFRMRENLHQGPQDLLGGLLLPARLRAARVLHPPGLRTAWNRELQAAPDHRRGLGPAPPRGGGHRLHDLPHVRAGRLCRHDLRARRRTALDSPPAYRKRNQRHRRVPRLADLCPSPRR